MAAPIPISNHEHVVDEAGLMGGAFKAMGRTRTISQSSTMSPIIAG